MVLYTCVYLGFKYDTSWNNICVFNDKEKQTYSWQRFITI